MSTEVSALYLLKGAICALEQCEFLLRDANTLYRSGSYSNAVVLAALAYEELGHWKMLLELRKKVLGGEIVTLEQVKAYGQDHLRKQDAGVGPLTFSADDSSELGRLMVAHRTSEHGSAEKTNAAVQLEKAGERKLGRLAGDRHKLRMAALYVDALSVHEWNRPSRKVSQQQARDFIREAVNDYATPYNQQYSNLEFLERDNPEWLRVLREWSDRPKLPSPESPSFPEPH
jgi:AbiV family abortive infection protein